MEKITSFLLVATKCEVAVCCASMNSRRCVVVHICAKWCPCEVTYSSAIDCGQEYDTFGEMTLLSVSPLPPTGPVPGTEPGPVLPPDQHYCIIDS